MRIRLFHIVTLLSLSVILTAMGGKGGGFERAPRVDKNFPVTVTDIAGNQIQGERFSWEGRLHFSGNVGMANVTIPFEKIKGISVGEKKEKKLKATARLKDGSEALFEVDADSRCYGEASFGSFMLIMDEISAITFK
jgi:hypothetical protein